MMAPASVPQVMMVLSFHHCVESPANSGMMNHEARYVRPMETKEVIHTREVSGASKFMLVASTAAYFLNGAIANAKYGNFDDMNFEAALTCLVWLSSFVSIGLTYLASWFIIPEWAGDSTQWWKLSTIITCGTLAGAIIPELVKVFTSVESRHTKEIVTSAQEGGPSLGILSGFVAGNFSGYYLGLSMVLLMSIGYLMSQGGLASLMVAEPVFAFGLVAFGFLGMGPVTIAVDSYGPVTDNAQSVFELSLIEQLPGIKQELKKDFSIDVNFERAKH